MRGNVAFRGQIEDFAGLYERTYQAVFRTVLGICSDTGLAADLAQDTYVLAYRQRASFRGDVPVDAWLHRIAIVRTRSSRCGFPRAVSARYSFPALQNSNAISVRLRLNAWAANAR